MKKLSTSTGAGHCLLGQPFQTILPCLEQTTFIYGASGLPFSSFEISIQHLSKKKLQEVKRFDNGSCFRIPDTLRKLQ